MEALGTVPPRRPRRYAGVCTCSLPLPPDCPHKAAAAPCAGCPVALRQGAARHVEIGSDDPRLVAAARELVAKVAADRSDHTALVREVVELYAGEDHPGSSLPKALLVTLAARRRAGAGVRLTEWASAVFRGEPSACWPDAELRHGPDWAEMVPDTAL